MHNVNLGPLWHPCPQGHRDAHSLLPPLGPDVQLFLFSLEPGPFPILPDIAASPHFLMGTFLPGFFGQKVPCCSGSSK